MQSSSDSYRYVVFPPTRQPTVDEAAQLDRCAELLGRRIAFGTTKKDHSLAIAFEAARFDEARALDPAFDALIQKWQVRGCQLVDHLGFVKDATALRPAPALPRRAARGAAHRPGGDASDEALRMTRELAAREATARSRLDVAATLDRYAALERAAAWMPYALIGLGTLGTIAAGFYVGERLFDDGRERRRTTIQRVLDDPMEQDLVGPAKRADEENGPIVAANSSEQ